MEDLLGAELYEVKLPYDEAESGEESEEELEVQSVVKRSLQRALDYHRDQIEPDLVTATNYYKSRPYGDEVDGKSRVVTSEVRDATLGMMPSLLRIFCGTEHPVEFRGRGPGDEAAAEQATDYVRYVALEDNPGFLIIQNALKDALVRRTGVLKWWWDEKEELSEANYSGLTEMEIMGLASDPEVEKVERTEEPAIEGMEPTFSARATRRRKTGRARFECVPPEEFVYDPGARRLDSAPIVAHVREMPASDLIAMGLDEALVRENVGKTRASGQVNGQLDDARQINDGIGAYRLDDATLDRSQRPVLFAEAYALVDTDGDGVSELRLFQCLGPEFVIANGDGLGEVVDGVNFAILTPDPEPHTIPGLSNWDMLNDVQRVKSQILRSTLDSLSEAVEPRTEVVAGEVNMADLMNPETSRVVRVTRPGMMREVKHEFVGEETLPMLAYMDEIKENRTGQSKAAMGLDADSLQSSTKAAVAATLSASQQRLEYIARVFAETGIRALYRGLFRLLVQHQDHPRMVRLRGKYVEVDPRAWDATMDVEVRVGIGEGTPEDRLNLYAKVAEKQEQLLLAGSPLVTFVEYRHTLARMLELAGERSPDSFFRPWGPQEQQQYDQQRAQQPAPADPSAQLVQVEQMKLQSQVALDQQKMELERWKAQMENDRAHDQMARDYELKKYELELKFHADARAAALDARVQADRLAQDEVIRHREIDAQQAAQAAQQAQDAEIRHREIDVQQEQAEQPQDESGAE